MHGDSADTLVKLLMTERDSKNTRNLGNKVHNLERQRLKKTDVHGLGSLKTSKDVIPLDSSKQLVASLVLQQ